MKKQSTKTKLHPRNRNRARYDLVALKVAIPELTTHIQFNKYGVESINFSNPVAVKLLNRALLKHYYGIEHWNFPDTNLCPPIPGRVDYLHYIADLLGQQNGGQLPRGDEITCLDIGVGASCIYPILGVAEYGWQFIASDIDAQSIKSANKIVQTNPLLHGKIECRLQQNKKHIFKGILGKKEQIEISICNPPFHASVAAAQEGTRRKVKNLTGKKTKNLKLNFAGNLNELLYEGGEVQFIRNMILESQEFAKNCKWFSTLVSKESNLKVIYSLLKKVKVQQIETIPMGTGNKQTRIVAWSFYASRMTA
ncbi:MAG: 23S rRNA (adenine(1618)-N(6))-methyltransferase RlmF [Bacteroidota bacterium]